MEERLNREALEWLLIAAEDPESWLDGSGRSAVPTPDGVALPARHDLTMPTPDGVALPARHDLTMPTPDGIVLPSDPELVPTVTR
jgi:hypothetical protein